MHKDLNQADFLKKVTSLLPPNVDGMKWLSKLLETATSTTYKKLTGEVILRYPDFVKICTALPEASHFLPKSFGAANSFGATLQTFDNQKAVEAYLKKLHNTFQNVQANPHLLKYVGRDLSFFLF